DIFADQDLRAGSINAAAFGNANENDLRRASLYANLAGIESGFVGDEFGTQRNILGDLYGLGERRRGELRGERDYQTGRSDRALDNRVRQRELEDYFQTSGQRRNQDELDQLYRLGYGDDPSGFYQDEAAREQRGADEAFGGVSDALGEYLASQYSRGRPGTGTQTTGRRILPPRENV
ncbi:MAG: hypothetical protein L0191_07925, partial [Acidobacteria bacterium]|nr:hypothetical protein [Acidobacteriota bacterium]